MVGMRDVAKRAGVSLSSVSLVVNGSGYVSQALRERVEQAMRELDYVPNEIARHLSLRRTGLIGVIMPTISHPFFSTLTAALQREFAARSLRTMLCSTVDAKYGEAQYVEMLRRHSIDAVVVAAHSEHSAQYWESIQRPIVAFDRWLGQGIAQVCSDHAQGGTYIADAIMRTGAKHVVMIGGPRRQFADLGDGATTFPTVRYMTTLEQRLDMAAIRHDYREAGEVYEFERARAAVRAVFDQYADMDVLIGSDTVGALAVQEARMRGIDVPQDLQIIAYDGTDLTRMAGMPLTAVVQDFQGIASALAERVEEAIAGSEPTNTVVPVSFEPRETTR